MKSLIILMFLSTHTFANDTGAVKVIQACFNNIDRQHFVVKYYSERTGTLVYEVGELNTVIVKRSTAYEISAADGAACKKIDLADLDYLGETIVTALMTGVKPGQNNSKYEACAAALHALKLESLAHRADVILKAAAPQSKDTPATKK
jgi:hypothetical protein